MKIAVLGTGMVGRALAGRLSGLGHDVTIGTRDPQATLARTEPDGMGNPPYSTWAKAHPEVALATFGDAAAGAELVVNATNGSGALPALELAGADHLAGKVILDISNPLDFSQGFPPTLFVKDTDSLGEQIQRAFPQARVVKTLNTLNADLMVDPAVARRGVVRLRLRRRRGREGHGHRAAGELRPHRRHRPRRHQHRPGHRDAAAGVAAAHGSPGHRRVQLQDRPLTMGTMTGKTVLVTGGTGGIGLATAAGLAGLGARVGIVGRDADRVRSRREAAARHPAAQVDVFVADVSSQDEVRRLATEVLTAYPHLDVLVNNVGGYWATRHITVDGLEHTFAVNHLAPFLLTNLLLDRLRASAPARVVTVSSGAQAMGRIDFDDLQGERDYSGQRAYNQSKLANVMFTYELARRLAGTGVTANALHPGVVRTNFGREDSKGWMRLMLPVIRPFMKSPEHGRGDLDLPRVVRRGGGRDRPLLRQQQAQGLIEGIAGHRRGSPALGRLRGARRAPGHTQRPRLTRPRTMKGAE